MPEQQDTRSVQTESRDQLIASAIAQQTATLRTVLERLDELVLLLTPKPSDGPTLDELLAGLITLVSDQAVLLKRIDARTAVMVEPHLYADTFSGGSGAEANGKVARG